MRGPRVLEFLNEQHEILEKNDWDNPKREVVAIQPSLFDDLNSKEASSRALGIEGCCALGGRQSSRAGKRRERYPPRCVSSIGSSGAWRGTNYQRNV